MIKVTDNEIVQIGLPRSSINRNGETIINYHLQSEAELKKEGWLPLEIVEPDFNIEVEELVFDRYEILKTKVKKIYIVIEKRPIPIPMEEQIMSIRRAVQTVLRRIDDLSEEELEAIINVYPDWEEMIGEGLNKDEVVRYKGILYKAINDIDEIKTEFNPLEANYLYARVIEETIIGEWEQRDYTNPYEVGALVIWKGAIYELIEGGNAYSYNPTDYPQGWKLRGDL